MLQSIRKGFASFALNDFLYLINQLKEIKRELIITLEQNRVCQLVTITGTTVLVTYHAANTHLPLDKRAAILADESFRCIFF